MAVEKDEIGLRLAALYRQEKQIIKAIQAITEASASSKTDDRIIYEMALIAKSAGRERDYSDKINSLIRNWKTDTRSALSLS